MSPPLGADSGIFDKQCVAVVTVEPTSKVPACPGLSRPSKTHADPARKDKEANTKMNFMQIRTPFVVVASLALFVTVFVYVFYISFLRKTIEEIRSNRVGQDSSAISSSGNDFNDDDYLAKVMSRKELIQNNVFVRKIRRQESARNLLQLLAISRGEVVVSDTEDEEIGGAGEPQQLSSDAEETTRCDRDHDGNGGCDEGFVTPLWRRCLRRRHDDPECAICLEYYSPNDFIAWAKDGGEAKTSSNNTLASSAGCPHIFHKECIFAWLQDHDGCPLCRKKIVHNDASVRFAGWNQVKV